MPTRKESDSLGNLEVPIEAYYGIYTQRAKANFSITNHHVNMDLINAITIIKKAAALVNKDLKLLSESISDAIVASCDEILGGSHYESFITHPLQGGAGTSTNMNVNEVIANISIENLGGKKGDYHIVHPIDHVNCSQSTNDVYPTAIRIAAINKIRCLAEVLSNLQESLQQKENEFSEVLKLGRTQLSDALPITLGQEFGAYSKAISRDRWRIYKVEERLREVNIGGTAIGTGLNAPQEYIYRMTDKLQRLTGLGIARSDLLVDTTQNTDVFVEVSGLLKACAVNIIKISNDLRLMGSGPKGGLSEIYIEPRQAGSSIMPGKVNPVICEMMVQVAYKIIGNDSSITLSAFSGQLELNAFSPLIAECLLESLDLLINSIPIFDKDCIQSVKANERHCLDVLKKSSALSAVLIDYIGYDQASAIAKESFEKDISIETLLLSKKIFNETEINKIFNVYQVTKPGIPGRS
ncbi:aspartate ammonia-lyase [Alkalibaculum sp. M08DMB]|uniref:Aspartate ammonia-lyase n=1 Tax=Alkalibaculum sporogenes TaxID=2655001 RepID=A0A6A7K4T2_9FIRM|nr:aspartate ammonia-lyase [Alkalibaculum sporogenes]MPW24390.1 aspartate ammonia-lyase [Alkalibaculum sporogenes]